MSPISRRQFLRGAALGSAALYARPLLSHLAWSISPDPARFPYGVASGDPLADRVVIWTKVTAADTVDVAWKVATDSSFSLGSIVRQGAFPTDAGRDHTVSVDVDGLDPGGNYFYRFEALGDVSRTGRTRTAPPLPHRSPSPSPPARTSRRATTRRGGRSPRGTSTSSSTSATTSTSTRTTATRSALTCRPTRS